MDFNNTPMCRVHKTLIRSNKCKLSLGYPVQSFSVLQGVTMDKRDYLRRNLILKDHKNYYFQQLGIMQEAQSPPSITSASPSSSVLDGPFVPLTNEQAQLVDRTFNSVQPENKNKRKRLDADKVDETPCLTKFKIDIYLRDVLSLRPNQWLNDNVINFYMELLNQREEEIVSMHVKAKKSYCYSSFFLNKLLGHSEKRFSEYFHGDVAKWVSKMNKFECEKLIFPLHIAHQNHWVLIVADMENRQILWFDPLNVLAHRNAFTNTLKHFLQDEEAKHISNLFGGAEEEASKKTSDTAAAPNNSNNSTCNTTRAWHIVQPHIPKQHNGHDCGVFVLAHALCEIDKRKISFTEEDLIEFRKKIAYSMLTGSLW